MDIRISHLAEEKIKESAALYHTEPVVRIYITNITCRGAKFGIAFNDERTGDEKTLINGIEFLTDTEYVPSYADGIDIDYMTGDKEGFIIKPIKPAKINCCGGCGCKKGCRGCSF